MVQFVVKEVTDILVIPSHGQYQWSLAITVNSFELNILWENKNSAFIFS